MSVAFDMAQKYYPDRWTKEQLIKMVEAGKLSADEYEEITGEKYSE